MKPATFSLTTLLAAATAVPAIAQEITPLTDYDATQIEGAWSADNMRDADVHGTDGDLIGYVQNIVVGADDTVQRVVIETDNWLDIGDRVISVPWDTIDLTPQTPGISADIDESEMNDFSLFGDDEATNVAGDAYRASTLLDSSVALEDGVGYGYVSDLIFSRDGTLSSVVVSPDVGFGSSGYTGGLYAYPYDGYDSAYDPEADLYTLPYAESEVLEYAPYEGDAIDSGV